MASHANPTAPDTTEDTAMGYLVPAAPVPVTADNALAVTYLRKAGSALYTAETLSNTRGRQYFVQIAGVYGDMVRCAQLRRSGTVAEILHRADTVLAELVAAERVDTEGFADLRFLTGLELADELVRHATQTDDLATASTNGAPNRGPLMGRGVMDRVVTVILWPVALVCVLARLLVAPVAVVFVAWAVIQDLGSPWFLGVLAAVALYLLGVVQMFVSGVRLSHSVGRK